MRKNMDISRLVVMGAGEFIAIAANTSKTLTGVCNAPVSVWCQIGDSEPTLIEAFDIGRFTFDVRSPVNVVIWFDTAGDLAVVKSAQPHVIEGDPEKTFTTVGHRPAINPQLDAVMRQIKLMDGELRHLRQVAAKPAPEPAPEPAPQPAPEPAPQPAPEPAPQPAPDPSA